MRTEPPPRSQLFEAVSNLRVAAEVLLGAGLQRNIGGVEESALLPVPVLETNVEVSLGVGEVEVPDFQSESEGGIGEDGDDGGGRVLVFYGFGGGGDGGEVEGVEDHAGEAHDNGDNDSQRYYASREGFVLQFGVVPQHLCGIEKVRLKDQIFDCSENFHRKILRFKYYIKFQKLSLKLMQINFL
jgi:hypothetical protein